MLNKIYKGTIVRFSKTAFVREKVGVRVNEVSII